ncbi:hypothetical protein GIS00_16090 [Nakamurella sp. YIM 132087]|uniref:Excalibur calcium-binding domain-containing protein n=2 Tax=Nakamurella alba TaxID=2665158 RepID=A0A7K1FMU7_9ACTN|nr:hypothetical protein [Nakamurella alba]
MTTMRTVTPAAATPSTETVTVTSTEKAAPPSTVTNTAVSTVVSTVTTTEPAVADLGVGGSTDDDEDSDSDTSFAYFSNCSEAKAAGAAPVHRGDPGYSSDLDRDGDGVACES